MDINLSGKNNQKSLLYTKYKTEYGKYNIWKEFDMDIWVLYYSLKK